VSVRQYGDLHVGMPGDRRKCQSVELIGVSHSTFAVAGHQYMLLDGREGGGENKQNNSVVAVSGKASINIPVLHVFADYIRCIWAHKSYQ